jgi:hypothetical protein
MMFTGSAVLWSIDYLTDAFGTADVVRLSEGRNSRTRNLRHDAYWARTVGLGGA